ncbi:MAG: hypothetical protein IJQ85_05205 [Selenomonadaceae bacterium]|nr:hypothetical protein [Selenomonadaceae bacterium]
MLESKLNPKEIYKILIAHMSRGGCKENFLGDLKLSEVAFANSLIDNEFPVLYYEMYLQGKPRTDFHVSISGKSIHTCNNFPANLGGGGYEKVFEWYKNTPGRGSLIFSYDVSEGRTDSHTAHIFFELPFTYVKEYFKVMGSEESAEYLKEFELRVPKGWEHTYYGLFKGRAASPVRIDYFVNEDLQKIYAEDISIFGAHLKNLGFNAVNEEFLQRCKEMANLPFQMELQFNVLGVNKLDSTISVSSTLTPNVFGQDTSFRIRELFSEGGNGYDLMKKIESWGLSDSRWQYIKAVSFNKYLRLGKLSLHISNLPIFLKVRWREGNMLDAKLYFIAFAKDESKNELYKNFYPKTARKPDGMNRHLTFAV